ncbi:MAG: hypothetical protein ACR2QR_13770, partial [Woeseiaceae bacterium]
MRHTLIFASLLTLCGASIAAESMRPANFNVEERKHQLTSHIRWPEEVRTEVSLILNCFSVINTSGRMKDANCFAKNPFEQAFTASLVKAAKKGRLNPALIDGEAREVYLQFRVEFMSEAVKKTPIPKPAEGEEELSKKEKKKLDRKLEAEAIARANRRVSIYLNPGYEENVAAYGYDHVAGQRVIGKKEVWNDVCPKRAKYAVWVRAYLSEEGELGNPTIDHADGVMPTANCQNAIKETVLASKFTPALADGVAVPSSFIEIFGN